MNLTMTRGDTRTFTVTVTNPDGSVYDLTGCEVWFSARLAPGVSPYVFMKQTGNGVIIPDPLLGVANVKVEPADTLSLPYAESILWWDAQIKSATGDLFTVDNGRLIVAPDITTES
jgi:hypothetical protein